ncbi:FAD-dependent monooxygenase [Crossiella cryophila]|uniref:4,5-epoxidase n=1 Tax=Crossiella cryophila TaxID=43355 RepID=A0A7W7CFS3_9PSEU|nr:FAD-dependent monooxygenase [Crossiella cryophila]MBB4680147.1 4,5-epoxidase [Crossiella cryophila]
MPYTSALVVGAGPTGLTLACALRAAGVGVRVLDAAPGPATTTGALGLPPRAVEALDRLGALPAPAVPVAGVSVAGRELRFGPDGVLASQAQIETALRERLDRLGVAVEWGLAVSGIRTEGEVVEVRAGAELIRAGWVIGCDGAHSAVRAAVGIDFPGQPLHERLQVADVRAELKRPRDTVAVWFRADGFLAAFPLPGPDRWRLMGPDGADLPGWLREETGAEVGEVTWASAFPVQRRLATAYRRGRVLLAGDAAHVHAPLGAQGLATGIGDAENLGWKLGAVILGRAGAELLDSYEAERRPVAAQVLRVTSEATNVLFSQGWAARLARGLVLRSRWMRRRIAARASQLRVSYRRGPLGAAAGQGEQVAEAAEQGVRLAQVAMGPGSWLGGVGTAPVTGLGRVRAGDRVPDFPCHRASGVPTRLHAELGGHWALLSPFADQSHLVRPWLGESVVDLRWPHNELALIRPDGHLAWRGHHSTDLQRWLTGALGPVSPATPILTR